MKFDDLVVRKILPTLLPSPVKVRHAQYSMLFSADDDVSRPSASLISVAIEAIRHAQAISLSDVSSRLASPPYYPDVWPGNHYRLLAGLVLALKPKIVIEIGTYTGVSALSMKKYLPADSKLVTFDVVEWTNFADTCLNADDFKDGRLVQCIDDLTKPDVVAKHRDLLEQAGLIFIDAAKDGSMEQRFIENFDALSFKNRPIVVFDDIRVWNMLKIWRQIDRPKLDLTSFGHWAGTGLVEW